MLSNAKLRASEIFPTSGTLPGVGTGLLAGIFIVPDNVLPPSMIDSGVGIAGAKRALAQG
jgi:hypothetical protein